MRPSHKQFAPQYASMFGDASVVHAYQYRPPYPPETFEVLISLIDPDAASRTVLDAGCARPCSPPHSERDAFAPGGPVRGGRERAPGHQRPSSGAPCPGIRHGCRPCRGRGCLHRGARPAARPRRQPAVGIARAAKACQFFSVLGDKQRHGGDGVGEGGGVFPFLHEEGIEALDVRGELLRGLVSRARGAQPAIGEARDAAQASIAAPAPYPDRQARLLHGFWF